MIIIGFENPKLTEILKVLILGGSETEFIYAVRGGLQVCPNPNSLQSAAWGDPIW